VKGKQNCNVQWNVWWLQIQMQCCIVDCIRDWKSFSSNINFMKFRCICLSSYKLFIFKCGTHLVEDLLQMPAFCRLLS